jgi:hypothetical protein
MRLKSININDRPSDLLASGAFVNDVDALSLSQSPLPEGEENSVLVTGRTEKHTKTSAARHVATTDLRVFCSFRSA